MKNDIVYGVEQIEFATINPATGAVNNDWIRAENIEEGSVTFTSNTQTKTSITPEDKDLPIVVLYTPGDPDTFNFALLELSPDNYARFFNITYDITTTLVTVLAKRRLANIAIRLTTRPQFGVKKIYTYNNTTCEATYKNNITKTGLLALSVAASIFSWTTAGGLDAAYTVQKVTEAGVVIDSTPAAGTFDTSLTFASSVTDSSNSVTGTVPAVDVDLKFEFNHLVIPAGAPTNMVLKLVAATVCTVDFLGDYLTKPFRFTDATGVVHTGVFTAGNVVLT